MAVVAMFAPYEPARAMARRIHNLLTGNVYYLNAQGAALVDSSDVAWFQAQGFSATPTAGTGQTVIYAPLLPQQQTAGPITNPNTGNTYVFNSAGAAAVANADVPWFATQGYLPLPTPGTGNVVAYAPIEVGEGSAGPELIPNGNSYIFNAQGWAVVTSADAAWLATQGFSPSLAGGGPPPVVFPPVLDGTQPAIAADFVGGQYWASAATQASFAAWLTAIGATFTRASSATYLAGGVVQTAAANAPRFPTGNSGVAQGIRLTGAATNIILHSALDSASFFNAQTGTLTANAAADPSGGAAAALYVPSTAGGASHGFYLSSFTTYTANTYTISAFAKNAGYNFLVMDPSNSGTAGNFAVFDLTTGASAIAGTVIAAGTVPLVNGWVWCWVTLPMAAGARANVFLASPTSTFAAYSGDGASGIQIWGLQATQTTFPCDYIPTTTATVTQAADDLHGTIAWYNATAGTLFADFVIANSGNAAPGVIAIWDQGVNQNVMDLRGSNVGATALVQSGGTAQWTLGGGATVAGARTKLALAITAANFAYSRNGGALSTQASGAMPVAPTRFALGTNASGAAAYGNFNAASYFPIRGSNAGIQALTT